jgi:hypothetical protein
MLQISVNQNDKMVNKNRPEMVNWSCFSTFVKKGAITCSRLGTRVRLSQNDIDKALAKNRNYKS